VDIFLEFYPILLLYGTEHKRHQQIKPTTKEKTSIKDKLIIKEKLCTIEFADDEFNLFGTKYSMKMEGTPEVQEYLVHFPSFIRLAKEVGLVMLEISNFVEFHEDNKKNYADTLRSMGVYIPKSNHLIPIQKDIIGLYTTFVFQKVAKDS